ncbi:glycosyltransferase family 4 protein [bacterium]|nr:glycosyltransferase family 4 protein [candidate division CSSED10-310 bacterium]
MGKKHILFVGLSGYDYPHTRIRCYNFAERLNEYPGISASVLSFRDHLSRFSEVEVYQVRDRYKLLMSARALPKLFPRFKTYFYIQKAHYNAALPYLLSRMGFNNYIFDYDDYDVDLNVTFNSMKLRRFFFGSDDHKTITRNLAKHALGCVAASRNLYEFLQPVNPRVEYISTGVKPDLFERTDRSDRSGPVRFLWTGIVWGEEIYQGIMQIFNGLRCVLRAGIEARLEIVGTGQLWDRMLETLQLEYADIVDHVDVTGWMHPDQMPVILARADVGLLPFPWDSLWIRSKSPTKLFEYMASGLPVIATAIGEVTYVIQHEESGILAEGSTEFGNAMIHLAENSEQRRILGIAARKRVETHYSIPVLVDRLARFLEMLFRLKA